MTGADSFEPYALAWGEAGFVVLPGARLANRPHPMLGAGWEYDTVGGRDRAWVWNCWNPGGTVRAHDRGTRQDGSAFYVPKVSRGDPAANVYVLGGYRSRALLLDVDVHGATNGYEALAAWEAEHGPLPPCPTMETPSGGLRLFYGLDQPLQKRTAWLPGVDVLADGAGSAVWPSLREVSLMATPKEPNPGTVLVQYGDDDWSVERVRALPAEVPPAPRRLLQDVATRPAPSGAARGSERPSGDLPATVVLLRCGFVAGRCDDQAYALACRLARTHRGDPRGAEAVMREVWEKTLATVPGDPSKFTWHQMLRKLERGRAWVEGQREEAR